MAQDGNTVRWSAPEFHFYEKTGAWYIGSAIVAALIVIFALWQGNLLFVLFIVIAELLVLFWGKQPPRVLDYTLREDGILVGERLYRFDELAGYALVEDLGGPQFYELVFSYKHRISPFLKILVANEDAQRVGAFLQRHLLPFEYQPSIAEAIMRRFGL